MSNRIPSSEWRPIPGYEGEYEVSRDAQLRSVTGVRKSGYFMEGRPIKVDEGGRATLSRGGKKLSVNVRRIAWELWGSE